MSDTQNEILKKRIRERLATLGLSANGAGRKAMLGTSYVNDILSGKSRNPVPHRFAKLAAVLGCHPDWLMGGEGEPGDETAVTVAEAIRGDCKNLDHAVMVARLALALCRGAAG